MQGHSVHSVQTVHSTYIIGAASLSLSLSLYLSLLLALLSWALSLIAKTGLPTIVLLVVLLGPVDVKSVRGGLRVLAQHWQ